LDEVLEALAEAEFDYRPRYHYEIAESGSVEKELTQIVAALHTQKILDEEVHVELVYGGRRHFSY
jgi:hypothetical protein